MADCRTPEIIDRYHLRKYLAKLNTHKKGTLVSNPNSSQSYPVIFPQHQNYQHPGGYRRKTKHRNTPSIAVPSLPKVNTPGYLSGGPVFPPPEIQTTSRTTGRLGPTHLGQRVHLVEGDGRVGGRARPSLGPWKPIQQSGIPSPWIVRSVKCHKQTPPPKMKTVRWPRISYPGGKFQDVANEIF